MQCHPKLQILHFARPLPKSGSKIKSHFVLEDIQMVTETSTMVIFSKTDVYLKNPYIDNFIQDVQSFVRLKCLNIDIKFTDILSLTNVLFSAILLKYELNITNVTETGTSLIRKSPCTADIY